MRYLLALICPPAALLACHRPVQAWITGLLGLVGIMLGSWGAALLVWFGCILWAMTAVGDDRAAQDSAQFIRSVKPIPTVRD